VHGQHGFECGQQAHWCKIAEVTVVVVVGCSYWDQSSVTVEHVERTQEGTNVEFLRTRGPGPPHPRRLPDDPHETLTPSCSRVPGLAHTRGSLTAARPWPPFFRFFEGNAYMQPRKRWRAGGRRLTKASALAARTVAAKIFLHHIFHNCSQRARGKVGQPKPTGQGTAGESVRTQRPCSQA